MAVVAATGLVVGGTIALISARSTFNDAKSMGCPNGTPDCDSKASSVKTANGVSQLLYVTGGVAGAVGLTMILLAPSAREATHVGIGVRTLF